MNSYLSHPLTDQISIKARELPQPSCLPHPTRSLLLLILILITFLVARWSRNLLQVLAPTANPRSRRIPVSRSLAPLVRGQSEVHMLENTSCNMYVKQNMQHHLHHVYIYISPHPKGGGSKMASHFRRGGGTYDSANFIWKCGLMMVHADEASTHIRNFLCAFSAMSSCSWV